MYGTNRSTNTWKQPSTKRVAGFILNESLSLRNRVTPLRPVPCISKGTAWGSSSSIMSAIGDRLKILDFLQIQDFLYVSQKLSRGRRRVALQPRGGDHDPRNTESDDRSMESYLARPSHRKIRQLLLLVYCLTAACHLSPVTFCPILFHPSSF